MTDDLGATRFCDTEIPNTVLEPNCALAIWYIEVRETPFAELDHWHIARAIRQKIDVDLLVAFALSRLKEDAVQGTEWRGELADALTYVQEDYWEANPDQLREYRTYLTEAYDATGDEDLDWDAKDTRERRRVRLY